MTFRDAILFVAFVMIILMAMAEGLFGTHLFVVLHPEFGN